MRSELKKFIIGAAIATLATTAGYLISPIEVRFLSSLTKDSTLIGATYAVGSIALAIFAVWTGRLSDRFGRNKFIIAGCLLGIIYPLLYSSTYNIYQYMGVKIAWAFATVTTGPILMAYLQDCLKDIKKQGHYIGLVFSIQSILGAMAQFLGGYLSDRYSFAVPYFLMSFIFLLASLIAISQIREEKTASIKKDENEKSFIFGIKYIVKNPPLVYHFINNFSYHLNWGIKVMLWPLIIFAISGNNTATGSIFAAMGVTAFISLLFVGKIVDKIGPFKSTTIALLLLGISGLFLSFSNSLEYFYLFAGFFAIGEAIYGPTKAVLLTNYIENKNRGEIMGLNSVFESIIDSIGPLFAGIMLHYLYPKQILLIFISVFWISIFISSAFYRLRIKNTKWQETGTSTKIP